MILLPFSKLSLIAVGLLARDVCRCSSSEPASAFCPGSVRKLVSKRTLILQSEYPSVLLLPP